MSVGSAAVDLPSYLYSPRVSPIQISTVPFRVNAVKFAPSSASSASLSSSSHRLIALGSHQCSSSSRVSLHQLDTDVDVLSGDEDDADIGKEKLSDTVAAVSLQGDVNDIAWLRLRLLAAATSTGCIHLLSHAPKQPPASSLFVAQTVCPAAGLSINAVDVQPATSAPLLAAAGDSTTLHLLDISAAEPAAGSAVTRSIPAAFSSSTLALRFASASTLLTAGLYPSIHAFDIRSHSPHPSLSLATRKGEATLSLSVHPARPDTVAAGSEGGRVSVWDMRKGAAAVWEDVVLGGGVNAVMFLPFDAATVLVAGEDGMLAALDFNRERKDPTQVDYGASSRRGGGEEETGGAASAVSSLALHRSVGPVRDMDVDRSSHTVCAGTDSQQLLHFQYLLS